MFFKDVINSIPYRLYFKRKIREYQEAPKLVMQISLENRLFGTSYRKKYIRIVIYYIRKYLIRKMEV